MLNLILPEIIINQLKKYNYNDICEVRLRRNCPIVVNYKGRNEILTNSVKEKFVATSAMIESVLKKATEYSLYAFNHQMKQGFITAKGGIRIGVSGESVYSDNFLPTTITNISSINIRVPHEVIGCSKNVFKFVYNKDEGVKNTLIISPPGAGKTTFLRDIARNLSLQENILNVMIVDERFEIASVVNGEALLDVGAFSDIVSGSTKMFAFTNGIRALKPNVIITDELVGLDDVLACKRAMFSGVKVVASVHANDYHDLLNKHEFKDLFNGKTFERFIILTEKGGPGKVVQILNENLKSIYF